MDLLMRFTALESSHGAPDVLTQQGLSALIQFAESELTAIQVRGKHGQNTSLPLTDTQKQRLKDEQKKTAENELQKLRLWGPDSHLPGRALLWWESVLQPQGLLPAKAKARADLRPLPRGLSLVPSGLGRAVPAREASHVPFSTLGSPLTTPMVP